MVLDSLLFLLAFYDHFYALKDKPAATVGGNAAAFGGTDQASAATVSGTDQMTPTKKRRIIAKKKRDDEEEDAFVRWGTKEDQESMNKRIKGLSADGQALVSTFMEKLAEKASEAKRLKEERDSLKTKVAYYENEIKTKRVHIQLPIEF